MKLAGVVVALFASLLYSPYLRAADVSAEHGNDIVRIGKTVDIGPDQAAGDVVCVGCSIHLAGRAGGDMVAVGGNVQVTGSVQGDVVVVGGNLRLGPGAVVHGDVSVVGGKLERDTTATIGGEIANPRILIGAGGLALLFLGPLLLLLFAGVLLSVLCVAIAGERRIETVASTLRLHTGLGFITGMGVLVGFVIMVSAFHWAGPLAPLVSLALCLGLLVLAIVGYTGVSAWIGHGLAPTAGLMGAVIAGAVLVGVLQAVPLLGLFAILLFGFLALGAAALSGLGTHPDWLSHRLSSRPATPPASAASGR